jgi:hypothetical protein
MNIEIVLLSHYYIISHINKNLGCYRLGNELMRMDPFGYQACALKLAHLLNLPELLFDHGWEQ